MGAGGGWGGWRQGQMWEVIRKDTRNKVDGVMQTQGHAFPLDKFLVI